MSKKIAFANTLRGVAVVSVIISHYFGTFWQQRELIGFFVNAPTLDKIAFPTPPFFKLINSSAFFFWGSYGVALFFLISGFVIPFSFQRYRWNEFAVIRFFRIYPTYWTGFTFTLCAILIARVYYLAPFPYTHKEVLIHYVPGLRDLFFTRTIDGIIWTLEIELKFYILCCCFHRLFRAGDNKVFIIPLVLALGVWLFNPYLDYRIPFIWSYSSVYIIFMFIGVIFNFYYRKKISLFITGLLMTLHLIVFYKIWMSGILVPYIDHIYSYFIALLTFILAYWKMKYFEKNTLILKMGNFCAGLSYPLYVIHGITGYALLRILFEFNCPLIPAMFITLGMIFGLAYWIHKAIEIPSLRYGRSIFRSVQNADQNTDLKLSPDSLSSNSLSKSHS